MSSYQRLFFRPQLKGHSQLMHVRIRYYFLADLHVTYPGCQRLFMRGFRFRLSLTCRPAADVAPRHTREKTSGTQGTCHKTRA